MTRDAIRGFQGEYRFLSNFYPSPLEISGFTYPTVEHAFQAAKSLDPKDWEKVSRFTTPGQAKSYGRRVKLRSDWEQVKVPIMEWLVTEKFRNTDLRWSLISTQGKDLIEENGWGDTFWGTVNGKGQNTLGKILMKTRDNIIEDIKITRLLGEEVNLQL